MVIAVQGDSHIGFGFTKQAQAGLSVGWPVDAIDLKVCEGF
jgi:hypothetical protein